MVTSRDQFNRIVIEFNAAEPDRARSVGTWAVSIANSLQEAAKVDGDNELVDELQAFKIRVAEEAFDLYVDTP